MYVQTGVLKKQRYRCRRTAIVAAFMVLDASSDNQLDQAECQDFFRDYWQFVDRFCDNNDDLSVREFVGICEAFLDNNNTVLRAFYDNVHGSFVALGVVSFFEKEVALRANN